MPGRRARENGSRSGIVRGRLASRPCYAESPPDSVVHAVGLRRAARTHGGLPSTWITEPGRLSAPAHCSASGLVVRTRQGRRLHDGVQLVNDALRSFRVVPRTDDHEITVHVQDPQLFKLTRVLGTARLAS